MVAWSTALKMPAAETPSDILVYEGDVAVVGPRSTVLFGAAGKRLWEGSRRGGSPVAVGNGLLYYESPEHYLEALNHAGEVALRRVPFPGLGDDEFTVSLLWPREKDFVSVVTQPDPKYDSEGSEPLRPRELARRTVYGQRTGEWGKNYEGREVLPPLFVPQTEQLALGLEEVISIDLKTAHETRFPMPFGDDVVSWSADTTGLLCFMGHEGGHKVLLALTSDGAEQWRWSDGAGDRWGAEQSPIRARGGRVYAFTTDRILALDGPKLAWQAGIGPVDPPRFGTALSDGSLLVATRRGVRCFDPAGKQQFAVTLAGEVVAAPVVDATGNVYAVTATELVQIR
jgi:hypothetical protein